MKSRICYTALAGVMALGAVGCGGDDDDGGGGLTVMGNYYACQLQMKVDDKLYKLPQTCFAANNPNADPTPVMPEGGTEPVLLTRGVCTCQTSQSEADAMCSSDQCSATLTKFFKDKGKGLNPGLNIPDNVACEAVGGGTVITATQTAETCVFSGPDSSAVVTAGLTASNGDYEAPVSGVGVSLRVRKVVDLSPLPDFVFDETHDFVASGRVAYSVFRNGSGLCPPGGCELKVDSLVLQTTGQSVTFDPPDFVADDVVVSSPELRAVDSLTGTVQADGSVSVTGEVVLRVIVDGTPRTTSTTLTLTGIMDLGSGALVLDSATIVSGSEGGASGQKTVTVAAIGSSPAQHPPTAVIAAPSSVECALAANTPVSVDASLSTDPENDIRRIQWVFPGNVFATGTPSVAHLTLGPNEVSVLVSDARFGTGVSTKQIQVVDTTPPTLTPPPRNNYTLCDVGNEQIVLDPPGATDGCQTVTRLWGQIGSLVFEAGQAISLPPGNQTVTWRAKDPSNNVGVLTQSINIAPALTAFNRFDVRDRARTLVSGFPNRFATLGNAGGSGGTEIGASARVGGLRTVSRAFLRSSSTVNGNIVTSANGVDRQAGSVVNGLIFLNTNPQLPSSIVTFAPPPPPLATNLVIEAGPSTLPPGAYGNVIVHPNANVTLSAGRYTFESLIFDTGSVWRVPAGANVEIVVRQSLTHRGNFVIQGGTSAQVAVLVYGSTVFIGPSASSSAFYGWRLLAPNAAVTVSDNLTVAELEARSIMVAADRFLACQRRL